MNDTASCETTTANTGFWNNIAKNLIFDKLQSMQQGTLNIVMMQDRVSFGQGEPQVTMEVHNHQLWSKLLFGGRTAAGEAFIDGDWSCSDLVTLMRLLINNTDVYSSLSSGLATLTKPLQAIRKWQNRNSPSGSQRNISAHYDLGNEFYSLWLDETMMYSSAVFSRPDMTLQQASIAKMQAICEQLELKAGDHLLEIGSGWGSFAIYAAANYCCRVTTVTISQEQYEWAKDSVLKANIDHLVTVQLADYRELTGQYDKLVSIEMIEAVGEAYLKDYMHRCAKLLKPKGIFVMQSITMPEWLYDEYRNGEDFIQKHVFPGGFLPSVTALSQIMTKHTDFRLAQLNDIGLDYAQTLQHWHKHFNDKLDDLPALGFDQRFIRLWQFYLCYCQSGFRERVISAAQLKFVKPMWR